MSIHVQLTYFVISTAQTDLKVRYRTFISAWEFIRNLSDIDPHFENKKLELYATKLLKHDNINKFCLLESDKNTYQISSPYSVSKLRYRQTTLITITGYKITQA